MGRLEKLEKLKQRAEEMRQERDRAQGRLEEAEKRLKDEFEVDNLDDAKKLLQKLQEEADEAREEFDTTLVLVTHDDRLAGRCQRVVEIAGGRLTGQS